MKLVASTLFFLCASSLFAQHIEVSRKINVGLFNQMAPSVTGKRDAMLYLSDYSENGNRVLYISENKGGWQDPVALPKEFNSKILQFDYGHFLTFDGSRIYVTNRRNSNGNGYNIWYADRTENGWSKLQMMRFTVNSELNDASPSITADGKTMYFVRCKEMTSTEVDGCKIYRSELEDSGEWGEAVPIDINFNSEKIISPRIFPDKKNMIFSAKAPGGAGGYDAYHTKLENGVWSNPVLLSFMNTPKDEVSVSPGMFGYRVFYGKNINNLYKIVELNLPPEFRGEDTYILNYEIERELASGRVPLYVFDESTGEEVSKDLIASEKGTVILNEGKKYTLLFRPAKVNNRFFITTIDASEMSRTQLEDIEVNLSSLGRDAMIVEGLSFSAEDPYISDKTGQLLHSLKDFIKTNRNSTINVDVVLSNYIEDTIQSPELSEVIKDSIQMQVFPDQTVSSDTLNTMYTDSLSVSVTDSLESIEIQPVFEWEYTYTYHNNRTEKEIEALKVFFEDNGVDLTNVQFRSSIERPADSKPDRFLRITLE